MDEIISTRVVTHEWRPIIAGAATFPGQLVHRLADGGWRTEFVRLGCVRDFPAGSDFRLGPVEDDGSDPFPPVGGTRYDWESYRRALEQLVECMGHCSQAGVSHRGVGPGGERISAGRWRGSNGEMNYSVTRVG